MTGCARDATSPAKPLVLGSAVSLPPVRELTTMRSDMDTAVAASGAPPPEAPPGVSTRPGLSTPPSPHQADTPTMNQRPTSPFALHSGTEHSGRPLYNVVLDLPAAAQARYCRFSCTAPTFRLLQSCSESSWLCLTALVGTTLLA